MEWKGWKEEDGPCVYLAGDYIGVASDLGGAKKLAEQHIRELVANLLAASPTPPAEQQAQQEAQEPATVPYQKLTDEIDLILSDPDTELSIGAKRALLWMRTWVSVPLYTAHQQEAQEPVAWQGVHDQTDLYYTKPVQADVRPLYTAPQPAPAPLSADVVKDAARYRWLRATTNYVTSNGERIDVRNMPETWDVAIDAAIAAQGGKA